MENTRDFASLNASLLQEPLVLLNSWLPDGKLRGVEYVCSGVGGGKGESLSVNTRTGAWMDGAVPDHRGGDLVSLYAAIHRIKQGEAYRRLTGGVAPAPVAMPVASNIERQVGVVPPAGQQSWRPSQASAVWTYRAVDGSVLFHVARYERADGKKSFTPWSWGLDKAGRSAWVAKGWPAPRPIYGLDVLTAAPTAAVIVVEGEKACEAARTLLGEGSPYVCVTWANGAAGVGTADWSPLAGRKMLLWPDADDAGRKAMDTLGALLGGVGVPEIKLVSTAGLADGFDAADLDIPPGWANLGPWLAPRVDRWASAIGAPRPESGVLVLHRANATNPVTEPSGALHPSILNKAQHHSLAMTRAGSVICNAENVLRALSRVPEFSKLCYWDEFHKKRFTANSYEWSDIDTKELLIRLQAELGFLRLSKDPLEDALAVYAQEHKRNEPKDWLQTLKWDGIPRIQSFFMDALGAADTEYTLKASNNWWISMVARIYSPGCQVDTMPVLEGEQGAGKSSALRLIGGPWYAEASESVTTKDFYLCLQGKLILEISELDAFGKAEVSRVKQIISSRSDRYREPYDRKAADHPRQCVFVGTTNEHSYLCDSTGGRRFWPIRVGRIDCEYVKDNRNQLFAEAVAAFKEGLTWHEMPPETLKVQESRRQTDAWEPDVVSFLRGREAGVTIREILSEAIGLPLEKRSKLESGRIAKILRAQRWESGESTEYHKGFTAKVFRPIDPIAR